MKNLRTHPGSVSDYEEVQKLAMRIVASISEGPEQDILLETLREATSWADPIGTPGTEASA